jgi:hypothetical protein
LGGAWIQWEHKFDNLDIYAPNGTKYVYKIVEVKNELAGYETWAFAGDLTQPELTVDKYISADADGNASVSGLEAATDDVTDAVFANSSASDDENVVLNGRKVWNDYNDAMGFRPSDLVIRVYRYADSQKGQNNAIAKAEVTANGYDITWDKTETNIWTYTVTGKNGELERNAPNGMPWRYTVEEELPEHYKTVNTSASAASSADENGDVDMNDLVNSITTDAAFAKTWLDSDGNTITEDILGDDISVTFKLQVAEAIVGADGSVTIKSLWNDAESYFTDAQSGIFEDENSALYDFFKDFAFEKTLTGRVGDNIFTSGGSFDDMPAVIKKDGSYVNLVYRAVETEIELNGAYVELSVRDIGDWKEYSYLIISGQGTLEDYIVPVYIEDGEMSENGSYSYTDVMTYNRIRTVDLTVTKTWENDGGNIYDTRPSTGRTGFDWEVSFVIERSYDGGASWNVVYNEDGAPKTVTLYGTDGDAGVSGEIGPLPFGGAENDGTGSPQRVEYIYRARELQPGWTNETIEDGTAIAGKKYNNNSYDVAYSDNTAANGTSVVNSMEWVEFTADKKWIAGDGADDKTAVSFMLQYKAQDGSWRDFREVKLDGTADTVTSVSYCYEKNAWQGYWKVPAALPQSDTSAGEKTQYRIIEKSSDSSYVQVGDTESTGAGSFEITNNKTVAFKVTKNWYGFTDAELNGKTVTVQLYRTTEPYTYGGGIKPSGEVSDIGDFAGLENVAAAELTAANGWTYTFKDYTDASGKKQALTQYNEDGERYYYFVREVGSDGEPVGDDDFFVWYEESYTVNGSYDETANGDYKYNYDTEISNIAKIDVSGTKTWKDVDREDGERPDNIELTLYRYRKNETADQKVKVELEPEWTKDGADVWQYVYKELPETDENGSKFIYVVEEDVPEGYELTQNGYDLVNTLTGEVDLTVNKVWIDNGNEDGARPASVSFTIKDSASGKVYATLKLIADADGNVTAETNWQGGGSLTYTKTEWSYKFIGLPEFNENGRTIDYAVVETKTADYDSAVSDTEYDADGNGESTVTNTAKVTLTVNKSWYGVNAADMQGVTVKIYRTTDSYTFADGMTPAEDVTQLPELENVEELASVELSEVNGWSHTFESYVDASGAEHYLAKYSEDGERYTYFVREVDSDGNPVGDGFEYSALYAEGYADGTHKNGFETQIANAAETQITGTKTWKDESNSYGTRPSADDFVLTLYRSTEGGEEEKVDAQPVWSKTDADVWEYSYSGLPVTDGFGREYTYRVEEKKVDKYETAQNGYELVNTLTDTIDFTIDKTWLDNADEDGTRPGSLIFVLKDENQGRVYATLEIKKGADGSLEAKTSWNGGGSLEDTADKWSYTFNALPEYDENGRKIDYVVEELSVPGYESDISGARYDEGDDGNGSVGVMNTPKVSLEVSKSWYGVNAADMQGVTIKLYRTTDGYAFAEAMTPAEDMTQLSELENVEELASAELSEANGWSHTFESYTDALGEEHYLAKYSEDGRRYIYFVREVDADGNPVGDGFEYSVSYAEGYDDGTHKNDFETQIANVAETRITGTKTWKDEGNAYGTRPSVDDFVLTLYRSAEGGEEEKVDAQPVWSKTDADVWEYSYDGLPVTDGFGREYTYRVEEKKVDKYETAQNGYELVNTLTDTIDFTIDKTWLDNADEDGTRPGSLIFVLKDENQGRVYATLEIKKGADGSLEAKTSWNGGGSLEDTADKWSYTFNALPEYDENGRKIDYVVEELSVPGYESDISGARYDEGDDGNGSVGVTNTPKVSLEVSKKWYGVTEDDIRSVTVKLYRTTDGYEFAEAMTPAADVTQLSELGNVEELASIELSEANGWTHTFESYIDASGAEHYLAKYSGDGERYTYFVREVDFDGNPVGGSFEYSASYGEGYDDGTYKNDFETQIANAAETQITGTKEWKDESNSYGTRPSVDDFVLTLYRSTEGGGEEKVDAQPVWSKTDTDVWEYSYSGLPVTDGFGREYTYRVEEEKVDKYELSQNGYELVNTLTDTIDFTIDKTWLDNADEDGTRPDSLIFVLKDGNSGKVYATLKINKDADRSLEAKTGWDGGGSFENTADKWSYTFNALPEYDENGRKIDYIVNELSVPGYESDISGAKYDGSDNGNGSVSVTNTPKVSLEVSKKWYGVPEEDIRSVTVKLYRTTDGYEFAEGMMPAGDMMQISELGNVEELASAELSEANGWTHTFESYVDASGAEHYLAKYSEKGERYTYFVRETGADGNPTDGADEFYVHYGEGYSDDSKSAFATKISNTAKNAIVGTKTWKDDGNAYGTRPGADDFVLTLYRSTEGGGEEKVDAQPIWSETDTDVWTYCFAGLPLTDGEGHEYIYRVEESVPAGYELHIDESGLLFENTLKDILDITVEKLWDDSSDKSGERPDEITIVLYADGKEYERAVLSADDAVGEDEWRHTFTELPEYDENGRRIVYTVDEANVPEDYEVQITDVIYGEDGNGEATVTNTRNGVLTVEKAVSGYGDKSQGFEFTVTLDDKDVNGVFGDMEFKDGCAKFTLKHGESVTATGLPAGAGYIVTEEKYEGYETTSEGETGSIIAGDTAVVKFNNDMPNDPNKQDGTDKTDGVSTGDVSNVGAYKALAAVSLSAAALAGTWLIADRRKKKK